MTSIPVTGAPHSHRHIVARHGNLAAYLDLLGRFPKPSELLALEKVVNHEGRVVVVGGEEEQGRK